MGVGLLCLAAQFACCQDEVPLAQAETQEIDIDCATDRFAIGTVQLAFDPAYAQSAALDSATVVLRFVAEAGTAQATTNEVARTDAGTSGTYTFHRPEGVPASLLFIHQTCAADGTPVGEPLTASVAFAEAVSGDAAATVDTRENPLQQEADARVESVPIAYDSAWFEHLSPARLRLVGITVRRKKGEIFDTVSTTLLETDAPAAGTQIYPFNYARGGETELQLQPLNAEGNALAEPLSATFALPVKWGTCIFVY